MGSLHIYIIPFFLIIKKDYLANHLEKPPLGQLWLMMDFKHPLTVISQKNKAAQKVSAFWAAPIPHLFLIRFEQ